MAAKHSMDLTRGSVAKKLMVFALPILLANLLQQLYQCADVVVVGNFAQDPTVSLAAVGSTASITNLFLNLFLGLAVGANVVCANLFGSGNHDSLRRAMHSSIVLALASGVVIGIAGYFATPFLLEKVMDSPEDVIGQATDYMQIVFLGQPGSLVFNFGAGILRSRGDTKRPMYILSATGLLNVILNLVFVAGFGLDAAGVALATTISVYVSAGAVLFILFHPSGEYHLRFAELRLAGKETLNIVKIGVPCGLNGIIFSLSNVVIVKALNNLGANVLAGNSAASNVDSVTYQILNAFYSAAVSFAGQNYGAKNLKRIDRLLGWSIALSVGFVLLADVFLFAFPKFFLGLFTRDATVASIGISRMYVMGAGYVIYCVSEMAIGCCRGMGKSLVTTILNAFFICVPRVIWVWTLYPVLMNGDPAHDYLSLLWCYPVSWTLSALAQIVTYLVYRIREGKRFAMERNRIPT